MAKAKKLPSGNWRVQVYDKNTKKYKSFTAKTKKEAEYKAAEYSLHSHEDNSYENMTLKEAYERYIASKSSVLSPSTVREYTRASKSDFPQLMPMRLSKLTPELIQTAVNEAAAVNSPKSVRNKHGLLHSVLKAYYPRLTLNTRLPQKKKTEHNIPTTAEVQILIENAPPRLKVPILLASSGSLRRSEISALTPNDFTEFGVWITKATVMDKNHKWVTKIPKTDAGHRFVPLPKHIIDEALSWEYFGISPGVIDDHFRKLKRRLPIPDLRFHDLRHYFASELHAQGIPDKYIAKVGGWESVEILQKIYQHTLRDKETEMTNKIVNIFSSNFTSESKEKSNDKKAAT